MMILKKLCHIQLLLLMIILVFSSQAVAFADFSSPENLGVFRRYSPADLSINIIERASSNEIKLELCNTGNDPVIEIIFKFETENLQLASNNTVWQGELLGSTCEMMNFSGTKTEGVSKVRATLISSVLGNNTTNADRNSLNDVAYTEFSN